MAVRIPSIIAETIARNADYPQRVKDNLMRVHDAIASDAPIYLFTAPAPDYALWIERFSVHDGETWLNTEWLFAEMLAYRLIIEACGYWQTLRDPFSPFKEEELASDTLWSMLSRALASSGSTDEHLASCLAYSLWGNRIDLSLKQAAAMGTHANDDHLLTNDIPQVVHHILTNPSGRIEIIMDNAGTEQAADLILVDFLLTQRIVQEVRLHVKMQPVLVSDTIVADMHALLHQMSQKGGEAANLAARLHGFLNTGQLQIVPDFFWNTAGRLWELPPRIQKPMQDALLVISKGDLNYRRATNDALWPPEATLNEAVPGFPAPLLALRTLKSDTLVGVNQDQQSELDASSTPDWRTSGRYGVAQFSPAL